MQGLGFVVLGWASWFWGWDRELGLGFVVLGLGFVADATRRRLEPIIVSLVRCFVEGWLQMAKVQRWGSHLGHWGERFGGWGTKFWLWGICFWG